MSKNAIVYFEKRNSLIFGLKRMMGVAYSRV